mmetsp:Transcript_32697/g.101202  ORF Transcript_32697/g.101202 Transcript_32697/m.101202 type:complete len:89 (+) Transcript_32697:919-1185(+)
MELRMNSTLIVLACLGPSFLSQILRARYAMLIPVHHIGVYLQLLQGIAMTSLVMQFIGSIHKCVHSSFGQLDLSHPLLVLHHLNFCSV